MRAAKAVWGGVLGFVAPGCGILIAELLDDGIQSGDLIRALLVSVVTAAGTAGVVYKVRNQPVA